MILLDTNVVSELMRKEPSPDVVAWVRAQRPRDLATTAVTVAEIRFGLARLPRGKRRSRLQGLADDVFSRFAYQVLPFDVAAARPYASLVADRERRGRPINGFDAQIAAIALSRNATLATRNTKDFEGVGVSLIDPFAGRAS